MASHAKSGSIAIATGTHMPIEGGPVAHRVSILEIALMVSVLRRRDAPQSGTQWWTDRPAGRLRQ